MKKNIISFMFISMTIGMTSCSKGGEENDVNIVSPVEDTNTTKDGRTNNSETGDGGSQSEAAADSVSAAVVLGSIDGQECTEFKVGENIVFKLVVHNNTDRVVRLSGKETIFDQGVFTVYTADGKEVGKPWKTWRMNEMLEEFTVLQPNGDRSWLCSWQYDDRLALLYTEPFGNPLEQDALPAGRYYTQFSIYLNSKDVLVCRKDFTVVDR